MDTKHHFNDRKAAEVFAANARANCTFVRMTERQVKVRKASTAAAAAARPRVTFTVVTREA